MARNLYFAEYFDSYLIGSVEDEQTKNVSSGGRVSIWNEGIELLGSLPRIYHRTRVRGIALERGANLVAVRLKKSRKPINRQYLLFNIPRKYLINQLGNLDFSEF